MPLCKASQMHRSKSLTRNAVEYINTMEYIRNGIWCTHIQELVNIIHNISEYMVILSNIKPALFCDPGEKLKADGYTGRAQRLEVVVPEFLTGLTHNSPAPVPEKQNSSAWVWMPGSWAHSYLWKEITNSQWCISVSLEQLKSRGQSWIRNGSSASIMKRRKE